MEHIIKSKIEDDKYFFIFSSLTFTTIIMAKKFSEYYIFLSDLLKFT